MWILKIGQQAFSEGVRRSYVSRSDVSHSDVSFSSIPRIALGVTLQLQYRPGNGPKGLYLF